MPIACEICGSIDIAKNESGYFVCADCGARYTIEAIRNMLADDNAGEGTDKPAQTPAVEAPALSKEEQISSEIVRMFKAGEHVKARELYDANFKELKLKPEAYFYGGISKLFVCYATDDYGSLYAVGSNIMGNFLIAMRREEVPFGLRSAELLAKSKELMEANLAVYKVLLKSAAEKMQAVVRAPIYTRMEAFKEAEKVLKGVDSVRCGMDYGLLTAAREYEYMVNHGYNLSENEVRAIGSVIGAVEEHDKWPYVDEVMNHLKRAANSEPHNLYEDDLSVDELRKCARDALGRSESGLADAYYELILKKDKDDPEATMFDFLYYYQYTSTIYDPSSLFSFSKHLDSLVSWIEGLPEPQSNSSREFLRESLTKRLEAMRQHDDFALQKIADGIHSQESKKSVQEQAETIDKLLSLVKQKL